MCPEFGITDSASLEACLEAARDRCLHGLPAASPPPASEADSCVQAIEQASTCAIIASPETAPACAFLVPSTADAAVDAGPDGDQDD